jgi:hypothetical protein
MAFIRTSKTRSLIQRIFRGNDKAGKTIRGIGDDFKIGKNVIGKKGFDHTAPRKLRMVVKKEINSTSSST